DPPPPVFSGVRRFDGAQSRTKVFSGEGIDSREGQETRVAGHLQARSRGVTHGSPTVPPRNTGHGRIATGLWAIPGPQVAALSKRRACSAAPRCRVTAQGLSADVTPPLRRFSTRGAASAAAVHGAVFWHRWDMSRRYAGTFTPPKCPGAVDEARGVSQPRTLTNSPRRLHAGPTPRLI
ncbi:hypothetical protein DXG01_013490, partial [Tephrocybe rancida]